MLLQGQVADAAPGQLFDIGAGVKMHIMCAGNKTAAAAATIVLESMEAVGQALQWGAVMELLKVTRNIECVLPVSHVTSRSLSHVTSRSLSFMPP